MSLFLFKLVCMKKSALILIFLSFLIVSCSPKETTTVENHGYTQGTTYQVKYLTNKKVDYGADITRILEDIDFSMSTYRDDSYITKVNRSDEWITVDEMFVDVLKRALEIAEETGGDFDPTVGPLMKSWGFTNARIEKQPSEQQIKEILNKVSYKKVKIDGQKVKLPKGFELDFNSIAPGYTSDKIAGFLEDKGIENYMVEIGGEVKAKGTNEKGDIWKIGVDKPTEELEDGNRFQFVLELKDAGMATSGNYRKFWVDEKTGMRYAHTLDPHLGVPARNSLLSATIIADTAMDADAYATVCMVKGLKSCKEFLESKQDLEGYLVYAENDKDWGVYFTNGFKKYLLDDFKTQMD